MASSGRLPLLDQWIRALPTSTVRENARLSLLLGETACVRGNWEEAREALERARRYFDRKGDTRMEAIAYSKLSTLANNMGDVTLCAELAEEGLRLAPLDDIRTRIRLRGNLAVTTTWLESLDKAVHECRRVIVESTAAGLEHYAAIAYHNLGVIMRYAGHLTESRDYLERAARYWDASTANPFADNNELVQVLLLLDEPGRAAAVVERALAQTKPWPRPAAEAAYGAACLMVYEGRFREAIHTLQPLLLERRGHLGAGFEYITSQLIECLYIEGGSADEMIRLSRELENGARDPRLAPATLVALALAAHRLGDCRDHCTRARQVLDAWSANGSILVGLVGRLPLELVGLEHRATSAGFRNLTAVACDLIDCGIGRAMRWWLRRLGPHAAAMLRAVRDPAFLVKFVDTDPDYWITIAADLVTGLRGEGRHALLGAIEQSASRTTATALRHVDGSDALDLRRRLVNRFAEPVFIRSFGPMTVHKGSWTAQGAIVARKRIRLLLGLLVASQESGLTRDAVLDTLWPDADPAAAVNSLNQTVFQLRRLLDAGYKEGESPQYVRSNTESVQLNPDLVFTDVQRFRTVCTRLHEPTASQNRSALAEEAVALVRGEFLSDLRYEDWAAAAQLRLHSEVRDSLLPVANDAVPGIPHDVQIRAGLALVMLDPFDEEAHVAVARAFANTGRRAQARDFLTRYTKRLRDELSEDPSENVRLVAALVGAGLESTFA
jgi:DNA-binding SARP family transcriptional activator/tetratricopeptide (TPR) repeat protein